MKRSFFLISVMSVAFSALCSWGQPGNYKQPYETVTTGNTLKDTNVAPGSAQKVQSNVTTAGTAGNSGTNLKTGMTNNVGAGSTLSPSPAPSASSSPFPSPGTNNPTR